VELPEHIGVVGNPLVHVQVVDTKLRAADRSHIAKNDNKTIKKKKKIM